LSVELKKGKTLRVLQTPEERITYMENISKQA